jgi:two-component system OmpR family response regulator
MRVLLIEDDQEAASFLLKGLQESGHVVEHALDGTRGLALVRSGSYDALVIDRMLPGLDGLSILRTLRTEGILTPVLILSALGKVDDRVEGLRAGGDDYLAKPFAFAELLARLDALIRRTSIQQVGDTLRVADLELDLRRHSATRSGRRIDLQPRELRLLQYLMRHAGYVVTRTMLLENVWDLRFDPKTNVIDVHISRLRGKIDKGFDRPLLHTVRGIGYALRETE